MESRAGTATLLGGACITRPSTSVERSDAETLVRRWSAAWSGSSKRGAPADDQTLRRLTIDNRVRTPLDLTLKIWTGLANDAQRPGRPGWYDAFVTRRLSSAHHREALPWLAAYALDHGGVMALDEAADALADEAGADGKKPVQASDLLDGLVKDGLARRHPGNRFSFVHAQIAAFLGGEAFDRARRGSGSRFRARTGLVRRARLRRRRIEYGPVVNRISAARPS